MLLERRTTPHAIRSQLSSLYIQSGSVSSQEPSPLPGLLKPYKGADMSCKVLDEPHFISGRGGTVVPGRSEVSMWTGCDQMPEETLMGPNSDKHLIWPRYYRVLGSPPSFLLALVA